MSCFCINFGSNLAPFWQPWTPKIPQKWEVTLDLMDYGHWPSRFSNTILLQIRFLVDFGASKTLQDASKASQDASRWLQNVARSLDRSLDRSVDRSIGRSIDRTDGQPIDRSIGRPNDRTIERSSDRAIDRSTDRPIDRSSYMYARHRYVSGTNTSIWDMS